MLLTTWTECLWPLERRLCPVIEVCCFVDGLSERSAPVRRMRPAAH
jgi:hypothetical protein